MSVSFYGREKEMGILRERLESQIASLIVINLETAVGDGNLTQSLEPESFAMGWSFTIWECPTPLQSDSNSRSCINLPSRTAVSRIKGRRRISKNRLAEEFSRPFRTITLEGLPPKDEIIDAQMQRTHFANGLERQLGTRGLKADDWDDLFWSLSQSTSAGRVIIIFDEINWMGSKDPTFLGKLKTPSITALILGTSPVLISFYGIKPLLYSPSPLQESSQSLKPFLVLFTSTFCKCNHPHYLR